MGRSICELAPLASANGSISATAALRSLMKIRTNGPEDQNSYKIPERFLQLFVDTGSLNGSRPAVSSRRLPFLQCPHLFPNRRLPIAPSRRQRPEGFLSKPRSGQALPLPVRAPSVDSEPFALTSIVLADGFQRSSAVCGLTDRQSIGPVIDITGWPVRSPSRIADVVISRSSASEPNQTDSHRRKHHRHFSDSFTHAGQIIGASKTARDITERQRIETERAAMLAREQQTRPEAKIANRLKDEFWQCSLTSFEHR
jgi:hypothetical protein